VIPQFIELSGDEPWRETDAVVGRALRHIFNLIGKAWDDRTRAEFEAIKSRAVGEAIARNLDAAYVSKILDAVVPR
jgi:hypothetical protein